MRKSIANVLSVLGAILAATVAFLVSTKSLTGSQVIIAITSAIVSLAAVYLAFFVLRAAASRHRDPTDEQAMQAPDLDDSGRKGRMRGGLREASPADKEPHENGHENANGQDDPA